jgi:hypothetical protein
MSVRTSSRIDAAACAIVSALSCSSERKGERERESVCEREIEREFSAQQHKEFARLAGYNRDSTRINIISSTNMESKVQGPLPMRSESSRSKQSPTVAASRPDDTTALSYAVRQSLYGLCEGVLDGLSPPLTPLLLLPLLLLLLLLLLSPPTLLPLLDTEAVTVTELKAGVLPAFRKELK